MDTKMKLKVMIVLIAFLECKSAALLRTPKVYNALITSDQNLTPSRVLLQPTFHDSSFYYGPYGYNFGHYYDPYGFNPFELAPPLVHKLNANVDGNGSSIENNAINNGAVGAANGDTMNNAAATGKAPIPLNQFGYPPSLIPINSGKNGFNLAPFPYNSYPLIYDQFNGYPQNVYLPHFGVVPQPFANHLAGGGNKNIIGNTNDNSNGGKLPGPDVGQTGDPSLDAKIGLNDNPASNDPAGENTGFNGNPFLPNNAAGRPDLERPNLENAPNVPVANSFLQNNGAAGNPFLGNPAANRPSLESAANVPVENLFLQNNGAAGNPFPGSPGRPDSDVPLDNPFLQNNGAAGNPFPGSPGRPNSDVPLDNPFLQNNGAAGNPFLGNPGRPTLESAANIPVENPFLRSSKNSVGPNASVQPKREGLAFDGRNNKNNDNGSNSAGRGASNPVFVDRENGASQDQGAGANSQSSFDGFDYFDDNSQRQAFDSNVNGGHIRANSRSASDSGFRRASGIDSQNSQANGFRQASNSGSQSSQGSNTGSGFLRSSSSFQNSKRGNRQNSSENRTNANRNSAATRTINNNN